MPSNPSYLEQAYQILEPYINSTDPYKNGEEKVESAKHINFEEVWKDIEEKVAEHSILSDQLCTSENAFKDELANFKRGAASIDDLKGLNKGDLNKLLVNPKYKNVVKDLVKKINPDMQDSTTALDSIKHQLKEFIQLSQLANYVSYASTWTLSLRSSDLKKLGAMNKLQFALVIDSIEKFLSSYKENQEIKSIVDAIIKYLQQAALADEVYAGTSLALGWYGTNLDELKASFAEDKESLENALNVYSNNSQINQEDEDEFYDAEDGKEDVNEDEDEFYDAKDGTKEGEPKSRNKSSSLEKIIIFLEKLSTFDPIVNHFLYSLPLLVVDFVIEEVKKNILGDTILANYKNNLKNTNNSTNSNCSYNFFQPNRNQNHFKEKLNMIIRVLL